MARLPRPVGPRMDRDRCAQVRSHRAPRRVAKLLLLLRDCLFECHDGPFGIREGHETDGQ